jgi:P-type Mg2+ transporter
VRVLKHKLIPNKIINFPKEKLLEYSKMNNNQLLTVFNNTENGFTTEQAETLLEEVGINQVEHEQQTTTYDLLVKSFLNPFSLLLLFIIIISLFTDIIFAEENTYSTVVILGFIITISGVLHFYQDMRSKKSMQTLKSMVSNTTALVRDGQVTELELSEVVPGDIIRLSAGDIIPADLRVLSSKDLFISQSTFTGEAEPLEKFNITLKETDNIFEIDNICYMGTNVISGSATAIVIATGKDTYLGHMSKSMLPKKEATAFDKGVNKVSMLLIRITLIMVPLVFIINTISKGDMLLSFMFAITVAVGITPELLPMIVTSNLAKGSIAMAKQKTIVKDLNSIQNLGAINILCTDKTGTITQDKIILDEYLDVYGNTNMSVLKYAYLNSHFQTGLRNLLDLAIINRATENSLQDMLNDYKKVDEIPFDFVRRRMSIVIENEENKKQLITKGATEEILSISKYIEYNGEIQLIDDNLRNKIRKIAKDLNAKGLRVIAVAKKNEGVSDTLSFGVKDESEMILVGFVSFLDPPKESAKEAIRLLSEYGVDVKVITGDNILVAKKVCSDVGINTKYTLTGKEMEDMTDEQLLEKVEQITLFAKISPLQKAHIVKLLQQKGNVVGYMGDGVNDAPALIQADVSISVDTGVEIAKESSDIILLEKSLLVLEKGIVEGRKVFANIMKYLNMATSSNVGNMISVIFASIFVPFLPMLPIHILVQNLLYDFSQTSIPFDNVDEDYLKKPRKWETREISKFILWFAPVSSIFDFLTFAVLWFIIGANTLENQALFQTGWFVMGIVSQTLIVHIIRTDKIPFIQSKASASVMLATLIITIIGITLPYTNTGTYIGLIPLPRMYIIWLTIIMLGYVLLTEGIKRIYRKTYNRWL